MGFNTHAATAEPPLKDIRVDEVAEITHRKDAIDLIASKLNK